MRSPLAHLGFVVASVYLLAGPPAAGAAPERPVKEFTISVAEAEHEFYPGAPRIMAWAFNG